MGKRLGELVLEDTQRPVSERGTRVRADRKELIRIYGTRKQDEDPAPPREGARKTLSSDWG